MKKTEIMNKIVGCLMALVLLCLLQACVHPAAQRGGMQPMYHTPLVNDPFRINMHYGYTATYPPTPTPPTPPDNGGYWYDVSNWQLFLHNHGFSATYPPDDNFGSVTENATKVFQASTLNGSAALPSNGGVVDQNTYNKAVRYFGMTPYPTTVTILNEFKTHQGRHHHHHTAAPSPTPAQH